MSGVELIVGAVLGSIPIAIEVYDRSGRVFEVFSAFKQFPREVSILDAKLSVQRAIFRNNAINLLAVITRDQEYVLEAINRPKSTAASLGLAMAPVYRSRIDDLEMSFESCAQTAEQIRNSLRVLYAQSAIFRAEVGDKQDDISTSEWLKHVKARFRLALSKPKMEAAISDLRELNKDFSLITEQIIRCLQRISYEGGGNKLSTRGPVKSLNRLQRYHRVRYVSKALHWTLRVRWNCTTHQYHSFDVRVIDSDRGSGVEKMKAAVSRYVTCELAVTHDDPSSASKGPLHLEIQQACDPDDEEFGQPLGDNSSIQQLTKVLETNVDRLEIDVFTEKKSRVQKLLGRFRSEKQDVPAYVDAGSAPQLPPLSDSSLNYQSIQPSSSSSTDLSLVDDVCKTAYQNVQCCDSRSFLGSWSGPHAQWFCVPTALSTGYGGSRALSDIIKWISEEPVLRSLPRPMLVEVAGNVAEGIMQFYSTPWLASTDLGQAVRYFGPEGSSSTSTKLKGPYFMTRFNSRREFDSRREKKGLSQPTEDPEPLYDILIDDTPPFGGERNELLFSFGILMLEIGYARPWHELKQAVTATHGELSDYKIAEKLAGQLVNQLGLTYPKIIKKCLGCDFGLGETDMDNEDLQRRFLEDVVAGLQQLRDYMAEMNLAPLG
ncbi:hypothetical protein NCS56_00767400 [Fusarium sp. Ph1]|nr:hypothetical protein NCS56_00767400 [Fusarium sp. Ph1]